MPRVSVIIPAFDAESTVGGAIDSALAGTFGDIEVIVGDDASRDATAKVVAGHEDPRVRLATATANGGPAAARNLALAQASGQLVAFLDADDRWLPTFLERQLALFDRDGPAGIVACDAWLVDGQGQRVGRHSDVVGLPRTPGRLDLDEMLEANRVFVSAVCPRALVDDVGGFSTECYGSEDHDLWLRILERGHPGLHNAEPLGLYSVAVEGISASRQRMAATERATYRRALDRGALDASQQAIARRKLKIATAAELVGRARSGPRRAEAALRAIPALASAAAADPRLPGRSPHGNRR